MILEFSLIIDTEKGTFQVINKDTGEVQDVNIPITTTRKKKVKAVIDDSPEPKLTLLDNKCQFNQAAIELMQLQPEDKIDIKYENIAGGSIPVIGKDENFGTKGGVRLTKTFTISCKGAKHSELEKHGTEFKIVPHSNKEGLFILSSTTEVPELKGDENVHINEDVLDFNIEELIDDDKTEIDTNFFQF